MHIHVLLLAVPAIGSLCQNVPAQPLSWRLAAPAPRSLGAPSGLTAPPQGSSQPISTPGSDPQSLLSGLTGRPSVPSAGLPPNIGIRSRKTWPPACSPGGCLGCGHEPHRAGRAQVGRAPQPRALPGPGGKHRPALPGLLGLSCGRVQRQKGSSQAAAPKLLTAGPGGSRRPTYDVFLQVSLSSAPAVVSEPLRAFQTRLLRRDPPNPGQRPLPMLHSRPGTPLHSTGTREAACELLSQAVLCLPRARFPVWLR